MAPRIVYIAGVRQHAGKTVASLGMIHALSVHMRPDRIGYMKPVGQEVRPLADGTKVDKDAFLIEKFANLRDMELKYVSPVRLPSGVTKEFLRQGARGQAAMTRQFERDIRSAVHAMRDKDVIIAEGTGHPGVGSVVGMSNAKVCRMLGARMVYMAAGGLGSTLDELDVDMNYFLHGGTRVAGVVFNKLLPEKISQMRELITEGFLQRRFAQFADPMRIFGFLPEVPELHRPSMEVISQLFRDPELIGDMEEPAWRRPVTGTRIISQSHKYLLAGHYIREGEVAIIGAGSRNRMRVILDYLGKQPPEKRLGGMILTCDEDVPHKSRHIHKLQKLGVPALYVEENTSRTDLLLHRCFKSTKLQLYDDWKYQRIIELFDQHFDTERFMASLGLRR
jgi:BioD-like phosphotransacetylase family protein